MYATDTDYRAWLASKRWQKLRAWKLGRHPSCEACEEKGLVVSATEVHQVTPVLNVEGREAREALMFDPGNVVALCHKCHVEAHIKLGKWKLIRWNKKVAADRRQFELDMFKEKFGL